MDWGREEVGQNLFNMVNSILLKIPSKSQKTTRSLLQHNSECIVELVGSKGTP